MGTKNLYYEPNLIKTENKPSRLGTSKHHKSSPKHHESSPMGLSHKGLESQNHCILIEVLDISHHTITDQTTVVNHQLTIKHALLQIWILTHPLRGFEFPRIGSRSGAKTDARPLSFRVMNLNPFPILNHLIRHWIYLLAPSDLTQCKKTLIQHFNKKPKRKESKP